MIGDELRWISARGQGDDPGIVVGYGSKFVERSVTGHLRGSIDYQWAEDGVIVTLKIDPARLAS